MPAAWSGGCSIWRMTRLCLTAWPACSWRCCWAGCRPCCSAVRGDIRFALLRERNGPGDHFDGRTRCCSDPLNQSGRSIGNFRGLFKLRLTVPIMLTPINSLWWCIIPFEIEPWLPERSVSGSSTISRQLRTGWIEVQCSAAWQKFNYKRRA